jgi:hypothetical protein
MARAKPEGSSRGNANLIWKKFALAHLIGSLGSSCLAAVGRVQSFLKMCVLDFAFAVACGNLLVSDFPP